MQKSPILIFLAAALTLFGCGGARFPYQQLVETQKEAPLLITGVRIFDGESEALSEPSDVFIEGGRIARIQAAGKGNPAGATVIDGKGKYLSPGLIDTHVHLGASGSVPWKMVKAHVPYNLEAYLYAGVTTVYELGGLASKSKKLSAKLAEGNMQGPSLFFTHMPITVEGSHPIPLGVATSPFPLNKIGPMVIPKLEDPAKIEPMVIKLKKMGVHYLKASVDQIPPGSPSMSQELLTTLVDAAHKHGLKVIVHTGSAEDAMKVVKAKGDVIAHCIWRSALSEQDALAIGQAGIPIIYTIAGFENVNSIHEGHFHPNSLDTTLVPAAVLGPVTGAEGENVHEVEVMSAFFQDVHEKRPFWKENFRLLRKAGVTILVGTDSALPGTYPGTTIHQEMALLHEYGMSNLEVMQGATSKAAKMFLDEPDFGSVKEGNKADLLLLDRNPLEDLSTLQDPAAIIARGRVVKRLK